MARDAVKNKSSVLANRIISNNNKMDEDKAFRVMSSALKDIDTLLNNLAQMSSLSTSTSSSSSSSLPSTGQLTNPVIKKDHLNQNSSYRIVSKSELRTFVNSIRIESEIEGIRNAISKIGKHRNESSFFENNMKKEVNDDTTRAVTNINAGYCGLLLTMSLIDSEQDCVLHLPTADHVRDNFFSYNIVISIHPMCDTCFEMPHVDAGYCTPLTTSNMIKNNATNEDDVIINYNELFKLKKTNEMKWKRRISNIEYQCLTQQIYQVISDLDLQLDVNEIGQLAEQIICIIIAWNRPRDMKSIVMSAVRKLFTKHDSGSFLIKILDDDEKISNVRCHIGCHRWDNYHGIGMDIEVIKKIKVFWKPKSQAADEEMSIDDESNIGVNEDELELIACLKCCIRQGVPFDFRKCESQQSSFFADCVSTQNDYYDHFSTTMLPNLKHAHVLLNFDYTWHKNSSIPETVSDKKDNDDVTTERTKVPREQTQKVEEIVRSIQAKEEVYDVFETEVYAWGDNISNCLGISPNEEGESECFSYEPSIISFNPFSSLEAVDSIECSSCHTLLLTNVGSVYSCGDGSDGQLGHNTLESNRYFRPISWFNNSDDHITIRQIAAGSDETSSHSAAIDSNHNLYTWGKSIICGHVGMKNKSISQITTPQKVKVFEKYCVLQVSCGGGFSLVRATNRDEMYDSNQNSSPHIFSWGLTARGRLGLGQSIKKGEKKQSWCQCNPTLIPSLEGENIIDISAGSKHALATNSKGEIFAWGSNSAGECSIVSIDNAELARAELNRRITLAKSLEEIQAPSLWDDVWVPRKIPLFGNTIQAKSASAGGIHSAALDVNGFVYSWGGGGHGDCLGHGDVPTYQFGIRNKMDISKRQFNVMSGHLRPPRWAIPRIIEGLKHCKVSTVALGSKHGVVLTDSGDIYGWGDHFSELQKENIDVQTTTSISALIHPSKKHLSVLQGKLIHRIACGSDRTFCITGGDKVGKNIGAALLRECESFSMSRETLESEEDEEAEKVDCMLIAGGRRIFCHKIILAARSPVLMGMILAEERHEQHISEIMVPGIQYSTMKHIIQFLYTDSIDIISASPFGSILNLLKASKVLKLDKLASKCRFILSTVHNFEMKDNSTSTTNDNEDEKHSSTLPADLGMALLQQDRRFTDVRIIARGDNSIIHAHACILCCSSQFFRRILKNELRKRISARSMAIIELPGTYKDIMRLLCYLYTEVMVTTNISKSCEMESNFYESIKLDFMNAAKLKLPSMKAQCENAIDVTPKNSLKVLQFSIEVESARLKLAALNIICKIIQNLDASDVNQILWKNELLSTLTKCPSHISDKLFEMIKDINGVDAITSQRRKDIAFLSLERSQKKKEQVYQMMVDDVIDSGNDGLSILRLFLLLILMIVYVLLQKIIPIGPSIIFIVNTFVLVSTVIYLFQKIR